MQVKANIVEEDETEQSVRKYLNLGHTYGHAIEAAAGYGGVAHGEAVMIGLSVLLTIKRAIWQNYSVNSQQNFYSLHERMAIHLMRYMNLHLKN